MEKSELLSPDKIRSGQELIKSKIFERAEKLELSNDGLEPLPDGVADIEGYCKSSPRIMWVLKQPYDDMKDGKPFGGGWEVYGAFENSDAHTNMTWQPIVYSLVGIRDHKQYNDMPYIRDDKSMLDVLKTLPISTSTRCLVIELLPMQNWLKPMINGRTLLKNKSVCTTRK